MLDIAETMPEPVGFISYANEDAAVAARLYADLQARGQTLWFDQRNFTRAVPVDDQILDAIRRANYFVLLLTPISVSKAGYIRKEIALVLNMIREFGLPHYFLIPVRSSPCNPLPEEMDHRTQFIDLFPSWEDGINALVAAIPSVEYLGLMAQGPHAVQAALCDQNYLQQLAKSLKDRHSIAVAIDNALSILRRIAPSVLSQKIGNIHRYLKDFAACLEMHYVERAGELDERTVCHVCGAKGTIVHGVVDVGGKSPMDYNDNYVVWCTNCYWCDYTFEVDYNGTGPMKFDYNTNSFK